MFKILKYSFFDLIRSRWSLIYFLFYFVSTTSLLYLGGDLSKALISMMNIIIILSPLIGTLFGIMYFYNSREFAELLLALPIKRSSIFAGQYLGLSLSLSLSFFLGTGVPFVVYGLFESAEIWNFSILLVSGVLLTFIFTGFSFLIAVRNENRIKGFGFAILVWLFLAVIYDGLFLLSLVVFRDYPIEKLALVLTVFNPIDLSRILVILKMDISALLGYTGALFNKFFGTSSGMLVSVFMLVIWTLLPIIGFMHFVKKKDF
jgi:Cu-processing system permease protein